eukprot:RCo032162
MWDPSPFFGSPSQCGTVASVDVYSPPKASAPANVSGLSAGALVRVAYSDVEAGYPAECRYFDFASGLWKNDGVSFVGFLNATTTSTASSASATNSSSSEGAVYLSCNTTHFTTFMAYSMLPPVPPVVVIPTTAWIVLVSLWLGFFLPLLLGAIALDSGCLPQVLRCWRSAPSKPFPLGWRARVLPPWAPGGVLTV